MHQELEGFADPMRKEVTLIRKKIDSLDKEIKPLGNTVQKKVIAFFFSVGCYLRTELRFRDIMVLVDYQNLMYLNNNWNMLSCVFFMKCRK